MESRQFGKILSQPSLVIECSKLGTSLGKIGCIIIFLLFFKTDFIWSSPSFFWSDQTEYINRPFFSSQVML